MGKEYSHASKIFCDKLRRGPTLQPVPFKDSAEFAPSHGHLHTASQPHEARAMPLETITWRILFLVSQALLLTPSFNEIGKQI